jgi:hypothetical protein
MEENGMVIVLLLSLPLVLAQGQGITINEQNLLPYWKSYTQTHGPPTWRKRKIF